MAALGSPTGRSCRERSQTEGGLGLGEPPGGSAGGLLVVWRPRGRCGCGRRPRPGRDGGGRGASRVEVVRGTTRNLDAATWEVNGVAPACREMARRLSSSCRIGAGVGSSGWWCLRRRRRRLGTGRHVISKAAAQEVGKRQAPSIWPAPEPASGSRSSLQCGRRCRPGFFFSMGGVAAGLFRFYSAL
jgi:hypothetical protein